MKFLHFFTVLTVLYLNSVPSLSSVCQEGEEQFAVLDWYNNKVYADGKQITTSTIIGKYVVTFDIVAFCIPANTRLLAVTNVLIASGATLYGSIGDRLVTNEEWRCIEKAKEKDWYQVYYDDSKWPQAYDFNPPAGAIPNISQKARTISASQTGSNNYHCRAWIGGRPSIQELLTRSAYAAKTGSNQCLKFHLMLSFLVKHIFECVTRCQDYEKCVSMNFENSENKDGGLKICELNTEKKSNTPGHMIIDNRFDYYDIIKQ